MAAPQKAALLALVAMMLMPGCSREPEHVARLVLSPATTVLRPGQCAPVTLTWTPTAPLERREGDPTVFVHLLDGPHSLVRTFDHPLDFDWTVGRTVSYPVDLCQSALAEPLGPGTYDIKVGLYDHAIGYRWPLLTNGIDAGSRGYRVARVVVPGSPGAIPEFELLSGWGAREQLGDKQTRARQHFRSTARIRVNGVTAPGVARLVVAVPDNSAGPVSVAGTCGGAWSTSQPGHHPVELPITGSECEITLSAPEATGAYLEGLGWKL